MSKRILVTHPSFRVFGGAERVSIRIADTLQRAGWGQVTLLSASPPSIDHLQKYLGHRPEFLIRGIHESEADAGRAVMNGRAVEPGRVADDGRAQLGRAAAGKGSHRSVAGPVLLSISRFHRICKERAKGFDLCISGYNEQDFGVPTVQYLHHPLFVPRRILSHYEISDQTSLMARSQTMDWLYRRVLDAVAGRDWKRILTNRTLTNSAFMASILEECGFQDIHVLYPGFLPQEESAQAGGTDALPRKNQILFLGRFEKDKRVLETIGLLDAVHDAVPGLEFVLCGTVGDTRYLEKVRKAAAHSGAPFRIETNLERYKVEQLLRESLFYINAKPFEHFGMATVEAIDAGCIPLLHRSGSHPEIAGQGDVLFSDAEELSRIVRTLMDDEEKREGLRRGLKAEMERFRLPVFTAGLLDALRK